MKKIRILNSFVRKVIFTSVALFALIITLLIILPKGRNIDVVAKIIGLPQTSCSKEIPPLRCDDASIMVMLDSGQQISYTIPGYSTTSGRQAYTDLSAQLIAAHAKGTRLDLHIYNFKQIASVNDGKK